MRKFGLFGKALSHSFSKEYFTEKFIKESISDVSYDLFEVGSADELIRAARSQNLDGFNITIPYKEAILERLDKLSPAAQDIKAVNCVTNHGGMLIGHNTDHYGFLKSLESFLDGSQLESALVLGSGGASKAVLYALKNLGVSVEVVSRSGSLSYETLHPSHIKEAQLIVNCTPLGTYPLTDEYPSIPYEAIDSSHYAYDLVYNPAESAFLKKCRLAGALVKNGLEMLQLQAERSWEIWNS